jgi:monothiol glutaredoxin
MCIRDSLSDANVQHHYLEYGSYFSDWRKRNALKLWTGWPTFPMVFVEGVLVGGDSNVKDLLATSQLR